MNGLVRGADRPPAYRLLSIEGLTMCKSKRILCFLAALYISSVACSFSFDFGSADEGQVVKVQAADVWQNTGILIKQGDLLKITYISGKWSPWPGGLYDGIGSGGDPRCRCNVLPAASHAALLGRIGDHAPFLVGNSYRHTIGEDGFLHLGINDVDLDDNSGYLVVLVEIDRN